MRPAARVAVPLVVLAGMSRSVIRLGVMLLGVMLLGGMVLGAGCGFSDGPVSPAPVETAAGGASSVATSGAGGHGSGGGGGMAVPQLRTIEIRNPWGEPAHNLLVDGDFEMSIVVEGHDQQAGWLAFKAQQQAYLVGDTGGHCKSGLRCGVLEPGVLLYGRGASALEASMVAAIYAKPPPGSACSVVQASVIRCDFDGKSSDLVPEAEQPAKDGWCSYRRDVPESDVATCMLVESSLPPGTTALVDAATLLPVKLSAKVDLSATPPERAARYAAVSSLVRRRMPFGRATQPSFLYGE